MQNKNKYILILIIIITMIRVPVIAKVSEESIFFCDFTNVDDSSSILNAHHGNVSFGTDGITVLADGYNPKLDASSFAEISFGQTLDNAKLKIHIKKPYITDSSGNIINDASTKSSSYMLWLISDKDGVNVPIISINHMGKLTRAAGNSDTLYQNVTQPLYDADDYCYLQIDFKKQNDGYWYVYVYDIYDDTQIFKERFSNFNNGAVAFRIGSKRMASEINAKTVWSITARDLHISSEKIIADEDISDVSFADGIISNITFTDGAGNPISIGYRSDKINVKLTISENVDKEFNLYAYLTGYIGERLKSVQRIQINVSECDAGRDLCYTFDSDIPDMVKRVYVFDEGLSPVFKNIPSLYLLDKEENGEKIKYIEAYSYIDSYGTDYNNIKIYNLNGEICAKAVNTYYYPEDNLIRIEVKDADNCPYCVKINGLADSEITGYAYRGYYQNLYGSFIKGMHYDEVTNNFIVNIRNSGKDNQNKYLTVFKQNTDGTLSVIDSTSVSIEANSEKKAVIPCSKETAEDFYAILQ